jgi:hypothetical protein
MGAVKSSKKSILAQFIELNQQHKTISQLPLEIENFQHPLEPS